MSTSVLDTPSTPRSPAPRKLRPMKAKPGELRLQGAQDPASGRHILRMAIGEGVCAEFAAKVLEHLTQPQLTISHVVARRLDLPRQTAFFDELGNRGYDLSTFRWSIFLASAHRPLPKRLRQVPRVSGAIVSRWGRAPYDGPDLCASWELPARRVDMNLFFALMSSPRYTPDDVALGKCSWREFQNEFKDQGFDIRTFRFQVRHPKTSAEQVPLSGTIVPDSGTS